MDPPCDKMSWLNAIVGLFIIEIGCDGYCAEAQNVNEYPGPNEIVEHEFDPNDSDDEFDQARMNVAQECLKRGKTISGTMHEDGSFKVDEDKK